MFRLKEKNVDEKLKISHLIKSKLEELPNFISEILEFEVGINVVNIERAYDLVLVSKFKDIQSLEIYKNHPKHLEFVEFNSFYRESTISVDYEF